MAAKIMIFIDGSWIYANQYLLSKKFGENYRLNYGKLPIMLGEVVGANLGNTNVDIVRTYLFASNAVNYDLEDDYLVQQRRDFFDILKEEYHYEVKVFPINYKGKRLKRADRDPKDDFYPQEKCVDIALASYMLYYAAIPYAYDIAIAVIGDRDFMPMLQLLRRLGKRVAIASIRESCASDYADPRDPNRLRDFDIIWIGDYLDKLELKIQKRRVECESPFHDGDKFVYTDDFIRKGTKYYCPQCKEKFRLQKADSRKKLNKVNSINPEASDNGNKSSGGRIKMIKYDKGYGFIETENGDYFFHLSDLTDETDFNALKIGHSVRFNVEIEPNSNNQDYQSGKAYNVQLIEMYELLAKEKEVLMSAVI